MGASQDAAAGKSRSKAAANLDNDAATRKEMARLTRENARLAKQLTQTDAALDIMGKLHVYAGDRRQVPDASSRLISLR